MENALKTISRTDDEIVVGNYIVMFGGRDLTGAPVPGYNTGYKNADGTQGEFFSQNTNVKSAYTEIGRFPVDWEHGQEERSGEPGREAMGYVDWKTAKMDEKGWFVNRVLYRRNQYISALDEAGLIDAGVIGTSSEADPTRAVVGSDGHITNWPLIKDTLTVQPFDPRMLGANGIKKLKALAELDPALSVLVEAAQESGTEAQAQPSTPEITKSLGEIDMSEQEKVGTPAVDLGPVLDAIKGLGEQVKAFDARLQTVESDNTPTNDPGPAGKAVNVVTDTEHWKYDNYSPEDLSFAIEFLSEATKSRMKRNGNDARPMGVGAYKALAHRLESQESQKTDAGRVAARAFKSLPIKANEINQSTLANYGDEWVGVFYSGNMWESIRHETAIVSRIPSFEVPQGAESVVIPLESTDPTWYKVSQAASLSANPGGIPTNTVTASNLGTANQTLNVSKMGARVLWTGELEEDSVLPYVANLRRQLAVSAAEYMESAVIDGDTATGATTNINDIAGTPGGTEYWLIANGFRKLALVTNTANSRDGGSLTSGDFLETVKLMGVGGANADIMRTAFIIPSAVHFKALELADVKTRDVFSGATIENGRLAGIYGYPIYVSHHMHKAQTSRLVNTAGKVDLDTAGNNTTSAILAVRFDQWMLGWRRRMTIETTRVPAADSTEIVALMRWGMVYRDTEASAISYNITI